MRPRDPKTGALLHPDALHEGETPTEDALAGEVPMVDRDGAPHLVHADDLQVALHRGWTRTDLPGLEEAGHQKQLRDENSDAPIQTFFERGASGLTFGLSDVAADAFGADTEAMQARAQLNPTAAFLGNTVGGVAGAFVPGLGEAGLLGEAGGLAERGAASFLGEGSALARIGVKASGEAARGAVYGLGQGISETALTSDPNLTGEQIAANLAKGALWGAAGGAVVGGAFGAVGEGAKAALGAFPEGSSLRERGAKWAASRLPVSSEARNALESEGPTGQNYIHRLATTQLGDRAIELSSDTIDLSRKFVDVVGNIYDDVHEGVRGLAAEKSAAEDAVKSAKADLESADEHADAIDEAHHVEPKIRKMGLKYKFEQVGESMQGQPRFAAIVEDRNGSELGRVTVARELRVGEDGAERAVYPISLAHLDAGLEKGGIGRDLYTRLNRSLEELPEEHRGTLVSDTVRTRDSEHLWKALSRDGLAKPSYFHELDPSTGLGHEAGPSRYWTMVSPTATGAEYKAGLAAQMELTERELQTISEQHAEAADKLDYFHKKYSESVLGKQAELGEFNSARQKFINAFVEKGRGEKLRDMLDDADALADLSIKLHAGDVGDHVMDKFDQYMDVRAAGRALSVDKMVPRGMSARAGTPLSHYAAAAEALGGHLGGAGAILGIGKAARALYDRASDPFWWLRKWRPASAAAKGTQGQVSSFASKLFSVARKGASRVATPAVVALTKPRSDETTYDAYKRRSDRAVAFASNPEAQKAVTDALSGELSGVAPQTGQAVASTVVKGNQYVASKVPRDPLEGTPAGLMRAVPWKPSTAEMARWNRIYAAVKMPTSILQDATKGPVSKDAVDAVKTVYPSLYADMQRQLMQEMANMQKSLPYDKRLSLSQVFGVSVDPSMEPAFLAGMTGSNRREGQGQDPSRGQIQPAAPGKPKNTFSSLETGPDPTVSPRHP